MPAPQTQHKGTVYSDDYYYLLTYLLTSQKFRKLPPDRCFQRCFGADTGCVRSIRRLFVLL